MNTSYHCNNMSQFLPTELTYSFQARPLSIIHPRNLLFLTNSTCSSANHTSGGEEPFHVNSICFVLLTLKTNLFDVNQFKFYHMQSVRALVQLNLLCHQHKIKFISGQLKSRSLM